MSDFQAVRMHSGRPGRFFVVYFLGCLAAYGVMCGLAAYSGVEHWASAALLIPGVRGFHETSWGTWGVMYLAGMSVVYAGWRIAIRGMFGHDVGGGRKIYFTRG